MKRLWIAFALVMLVSFLILGWIGTRIHQEMPPLPTQVVATDGTVLIDEGEISAGQNVWQSLGGMEVGSIWGHGSYVAPDWTADWLHRDAAFILGRWSNAEFDRDFAELSAERQAQLVGRLTQLLRTNTYDAATGRITLVGFEAAESLRRSRRKAWIRRYKWPIAFFVAVAFWNMVGAGLFGFMINPPIALYYMQGLNTASVHGHAALFGVYGLLGIGLTLLCLRVLIPGREWKDGLLRFSFWAMNVGLMGMCVLSLLPVGLLQTWASVEHGYWYARSSEFMQTDLMQTLRWLRVPGDTVFFLGALALVAFVAGLKTGRSFERSDG